jgi:predicted  nucleic acid-binding Zn-ribbon protein
MHSSNDLKSPVDNLGDKEKSAEEIDECPSAQEDGTNFNAAANEALRSMEISDLKMELSDARTKIRNLEKQQLIYKSKIDDLEKKLLEKGNKQQLLIHFFFAYIR